VKNNIVYCNSPGETVERALRFSKLQETVADSKEVKSLISFLNDYVHKDYYLIECLKKGVAYHHGRMPQKVRNKVEELFSKKESALTHIFCTSTLLEGVNLPAKNIFVVNDSRGLGQFKKIDFENLIGRAGRLTKEFSGNVICIRDVDGRWKNERQLISRSKLPKGRELSDK
jgi:replicative superfamily II helicase